MRTTAPYLSNSLLGALLVALTLTSPIPAYAQLEEVVVTARKREESLQDVPISVQAHTGESIAEQGLFDIGALAPYTPNFKYTQAPGASDLLFMRGLGTYGSGIHFEPSVGTVFNGYFSTRSRLARTALIDVAQVEILKGPQGAIIGKNTSLGAINITSNKPTDEFEGEFSAAYNFESSEGYEVQGIASGPLSDSVRGRVVLDYQDVDGWVDNRTSGESMQQKKDLTIRTMLDADFSDTFSGEFMFQYTDLDRKGKAREVAQCYPPGGMGMADARTQFDCTINGSAQQGNIRQLSSTGTPFNDGEPFTTESFLWGATFTLDLGEHEAKSLSNYTTYEVTDSFAGDLLPTVRAAIRNAEDYNQFYQELRLSSTWDRNWDYTAGFMYFTGELDFTQDFEWAYFPFNFNRHEAAISETDSWAVFGQVDYDFNDQFAITFGGRYTDESRSGSKSQLTRTLWDNDPMPAWCNSNASTGAGGVGPRTCTFGNDYIAGPGGVGTVALPGAGALPVGGTPITGERDESNFSYNVSLQWTPTDDAMFYATYATGFKSGGFDLRGAGDPRAFNFGEEETSNIEVGGKHTLADGTVRLNWTFFHTEVDGLQLSTNDPVLIQQVVSPADVTNYGVEVDAIWAATDNLTLTATGAWLDSEYDGGSGGPNGDLFTPECNLAQGLGFATGCQTLSNTSGGTYSGQDLTGTRLVFTPEWQFVAGADYTIPVGDGMELSIAGKWIFLDEMHNTVTRDPIGFQDATNRFDATATLRGNLESGNDWTIALVGRNLSNESVMNWCNSSTLSGGNAVSCATEELRYIGLRGSVGF
jgi:iron complex outermembrane receptor protein